GSKGLLTRKICNSRSSDHTRARNFGAPCRQSSGNQIPDPTTRFPRVLANNNTRFLRFSCEVICQGVADSEYGCPVERKFASYAAYPICAKEFSHRELLLVLLRSHSSLDAPL